LRVVARCFSIVLDSLRVCFFFQAEDGIRDWSVTGVQTCALPISRFLAYGNARMNQGISVSEEPGSDVAVPGVARRVQRHIDEHRSEERRVGKEWRSREVAYQ